MKIIKHPFPEGQFMPHKYDKKQIYLHHTAGGRDGWQVFDYWAKTQERVATCVAISGDGTIVQGYSSKFWGYHLGLKTKHFTAVGLPYRDLNKGSIGIEICAYGSLTEKSGKLYSWSGQVISKEDACELSTPYRGNIFYQRYTDEQIRATEELLKLWYEKYGIPLCYNDNIFEVNRDALSGKPGVWAHVSTRPDKTDIFPQPEMIQMLKSLP